MVTEPFREWVLSGVFPSGRPTWQDAGATFTDDVTPYEHRKLWLLNGAHSLLAYAGSIRGRTTVADAVADEICQSWLAAWWAVASPYLNQPTTEVAAHQAALLARFTNARMRDRLDRIAADGSQKLPIRILPVLRAERAAGRLPEAATRVLAAWICHLRGMGAPVAIRNWNRGGSGDLRIAIGGGEPPDLILDRHDYFRTPERRSGRMEGVAQCEINHDPERHDDDVICPPAGAVAGPKSRRRWRRCEIDAEPERSPRARSSRDHQWKANVPTPRSYACEHRMLKAGLDVARDKRSDNEDHRK